jgi:hypothetical protein
LPKPLIICPKPSNMFNPLSPVEKNSMVLSCALHRDCMFEGGNLLNLNLTPVTNIPWKPCNLTSCVTQLQSHFCQYQSDLFIIFERTVCNLHLPTTIRRHVQHSMCTHKKRVQTWNLFFKKKKHCFCMVLVLLLHGWCNLSVL